MFQVLLFVCPKVIDIRIKNGDKKEKERKIELIFCLFKNWIQSFYVSFRWSASTNFKWFECAS